ncbi:MAG: tetratricopeptide repeat protein [Acidobacteria bacterium]|nr:tetratricopeptide repeat protein [Acidobacteriota bacterium]
MKRLLPIFLTTLVAVPIGCRSHDLSTEQGQARFGVEAAEMNLWREARFRFEKTVQMNPDDARNWSNLAVAYEGTGEYDLARDAYLRALQLDRANEFVQRNYSRFLEHYGTPEAEDAKEESPEEAEKPTEDAEASPEESDETTEEVEESEDAEESEETEESEDPNEDLPDGSVPPAAPIDPDPGDSEMPEDESEDSN